MTTFDYPAFLAARLDELEAKAKNVLAEAPQWIKWWPEHVLADIAAKRAILDERNLRFREAIEGTSGEGEGQAQGIWWGLNMAVELLSRPFADHPDYPGDTHE